MTGIRARERDAVIRSLTAGVVPRIGLHLIQVGRRDEVEALLDDLARIEAGGATARFIVGRFGTGKSFLLNLVKTIALEKKFVVMQAQLTPTRRLHSTTGGARELYAALAHSTSVRTKPEGGALGGVIERWISAFVEEFEREDAKNGESGDVFAAIRSRLEPLTELVGGFDFASVTGRYLEGYRTGNDVLMHSALRWFSGEYATRTEARADLGVRSVITDREVYDYLKLWGAFVRLAGYAGLLVEIDETGILSHRLSNAVARNANYEVLLRVLNDCFQGGVEGVGFLFAGTDDFLDDRRRGLMSYGALAGRLQDNPWVRDGLKDFSGPVIRLESLSAEELWLLLRNIRNVFAWGDPEKHLLPDEGIGAFMNRCAQTLGAEFWQTPRDAARAFVGLLSVLEQNPGTDWRELLRTSAVSAVVSEDADDVSKETSEKIPENADDELEKFTLK